MTDFLINHFVKKSSDKKAVRSAYANLACIMGIICNVLLFVGKFLAGTLFGSVSVSADAVNNLSDASSNIVSLVGFKLGSIPADDNHPYGHARYEYIAGLSVAVMVIAIGIELLKSSAEKIISPTPVEFSLLTVVVLLASIGIKLWLGLFNKKIGAAINSETLKATAADSLNDCISTAAVLIASVAAHITHINRIDGIMGFLVAGFILYSGIGLVRDTINPILGSAPDPELVHAINKKVLSYPNVLGIHDLMIHDYGPGNRLASFHIEMPANGNIMESHDLIDRIEKDLLKEFGFLATIHFDPVVTDDPHIEELKTAIAEFAMEYDDKVTIHDLRIVPGSTHTNVVFECVVPSEYLKKKSRKSLELIHHIRHSVSERWPDHICVIHIETGFGSNLN